FRQLHRRRWSLLCHRHRLRRSNCTRWLRASAEAGWRFSSFPGELTRLVTKISMKSTSLSHWVRLDGHTYIRNIDSPTVTDDPVYVDLATGLLGHLSSSRRYNEDIKPMNDSSEALYRLEPVTYRYKKEIDRKQSHDAIWFDCR